MRLAGNLGQMAMDCLLSTLAQTSRVEQLGVLQSEWIQPITGYEEFSNTWGKTLVMPVEGEDHLHQSDRSRGPSNVIASSL